MERRNYSPGSSGSSRGAHKQRSRRAVGSGQLVTNALTEALSDAQDKEAGARDALKQMKECVLDILEEQLPPTPTGAPGGGKGPDGKPPKPPNDPDEQCSAMGNIQMDSSRLNVRWTEGVRYSMLACIAYFLCTSILVQLILTGVGLVRGYSATVIWFHFLFAFFAPPGVVAIWKLSWLRDWRTIHRYKFVRYQLGYKSDNRADTMSQADMKHQASYSVVKYTKKFWIFPEYSREVTISHELLVQICTGKNLELTATADVVWQRLSLAARTAQSVNVDRFLSGRDKFISQDTMLVAYGIWKRLVQKRADFPFPRPQRT